MNLYADFKVLDATLKSLSGKDEAARIRATVEVKAHVEAAARELSLERFAKFENDLYQEIFSFVNGNTLGEKIGGILVIRELIDCTSASAEAKVAKFAKALSVALNANTDFALIELIADALGHMARTSPVSDVDYLEGEMNRALGWLRGPKQSTNRRFAACTVLQQLATSAPTIFFARINDFFDLIWGPLWDPKEKIRLSAGHALSACLAVLRERTYHLQWYCYLYDQFQEGFHRGTEEHVHGSLIVVAEALKYTGDFMIPRFKEVCKAIMALKDHRARIVRASIISLLPSLAELCPDAFARAHMDETVEFLLRCAKNSDLRPQALLATGKLCIAIGPYLVPRIDELMNMLRDSFPGANTSAASSGYGRKAKQELDPSNPEALLCISDMVQGLGTPFHERVLSLLEPMLLIGLTPELIDTLSIISSHMPNQRNMVQVRLLEETIKVLGGNSRPLVQEPDYLYSWAKVGERVITPPLGGVGGQSNMAHGQQLAWMRTSPGMRSSASIGNLAGSNANAAHSVTSAYNSLQQVGMIPAGPAAGAINNTAGNRSSLGLSLRGSALSPSPASGASSNSTSTKGGAGQLLSPPAKQSSGGFLGVMHRLGVGGGRNNYTPAKAVGSTSTSSGTGAGSGADNAAAGGAAGPLSGASAIGATVIGTGQGLGSERDKKRMASPAHDLVQLSLRTLSYLSVPSGRLILLIKNSVLPYLLSDDYRIRKEAATTCARMLVASIHRNSTRGPSAAAIEEILTRLLEVVVSDISAQVRLQVLQSLCPEFDRYLARAQHVNTLLLLLADEVFEIKVAATTIIGRLAHCNPAAVLPPIRQQLIHLISEMKNCPDYRTIEEAAMMLCNFLKLSKFHVLVRPFMITLISTLPLQSDFRATTAALEALGELSIVLQNDILPYVDNLLPIIITNMLDSSSYHKQEVAVKTLGQVVRSTGLVVKPYLLYPQLLPSALDLLYKNSASRPYSLRMEVLRTLGLLGALEPNRYTMITSFLQGSDKERKDQLRDELKGVSSAVDKSPPHYNQKAPSTSDNEGGQSMRDRDQHILDRDRADSNLSQLAGAGGTGAGAGAGNVGGAVTNTNGAAGVLAGAAGGYTRISGNAAGELRQDASGVQELIRTDKLAEDNADEPAYLGMYEQSVPRSLPSTDAPGKEGEELRATPNNEDYYPRVAVAALIKVLKDPSLSIHHSTATNTIIQIFRHLGLQCVPFLEMIVPYFLQIVRKSGPGLRESILLQLSQLVAITGQHIAPYLPSIIDILKDYWSEHLEYVLSIVQQIAITTAETFTAFLPLLLPLLLSSLAVPRGVTSATLKENRNILKPIEQTLMCHVTLRLSLRAHIHLFVPALCKLVTQLQEVSADTVMLQAQSIHTLRSLVAVSTGAVVEQCHVIVSIIVHTLCRTVQISHQANVPTTHEVYSECINTLGILAQQIGQRILPFDSLIMRSIDRKSLDVTPYRDVSYAIRNGTWIEMSMSDREDINASLMDGANAGMRQSLYRISEAEETKLVGMHQQSNASASMGGGAHMSGVMAGGARPGLFPFSPDLQPPEALHSPGSPMGSPGGPQESAKLYLNQQNLARAWDVSQRSTATDWHEWLWKFNIDLLRESPVPTMRACAQLAQAHEAMASELFHAAFVSCWHELSEQYQENLVRALQKAFRSTTIPAEILQALLNLAEFMEHDVEALPISLSILAELAQKGHAYAKALHYRELEFQTNPAGCFESLININKKLDQYDAASGLLKVVEQIQKKFPALKEVYAVQESWLAKLGHWDTALVKYNEKLALMPHDSTVLAGKMKCLDALGRWEEAIQICEDNLDLMRVESEHVGNKTLTKAAVIGARAAWSLNQWDRMDLFLTQLPADNIDGSFMRAILAVHTENYADSQVHIAQTRKQLDTIMTSLLTESYSRAYVPFIMVQQCSELEEIVEYKMLLRESLAETASEAVPETSAPPASAQSSAAAAVLDSGSKIYTGLPANIAADGTSRSPTFSAPAESAASKRFSPTPMGGGRTPSPMPSGAASQQPQQLKAEVLQRKAFLTEKWRNRIRGCCSSGRAAIPFWKYLLNGRRMVLSETEDLDTWLDFVSLCRNGGNRELAERVLMMSQAAAAHSYQHGNNQGGAFRSIELSDGGDGANSSTAIRTSGLAPAVSSGSNAAPTDISSIIMDRRIRFAILKQQWAGGDRHNALMGLESLIRQTTLSTTASSAVDASYLSCLLKLGEWKIALVDPGRPVDKNTRKEVLSLYGRATSVDPNCYEAWHQWGLSNYRAIEEARSVVVNSSAANTPLAGSNIGGSGLGLGRRSMLFTPVTGRLPQAIGDSMSIIPLVVNSIKGLMRALTLGTKRYSSFVTQDMLCILSLWFRYGKIPDVNAVLDSGLSTVHLNTWLGVLPQLIARIDHPDPATCALLHQLLIRLGVKHAQAMVFPLFVAIKSPRGRRKEAAETLMNSLKQHSAKLIDQALLVSQELVRVAILWEENWHLNLEEAAKLFFGDGNIQGMVDMLVPLHNMVLAGANTLRESAFLQSHGNDLGDAWQCIKNYLAAMEENGMPLPTAGANKKNTVNQRPEDHFLYQAWDYYFAVFKRINAQLPQITALDLQTCSPALYTAHDLDLGVPGTYSVSGHAVRIKSFGAVVGIIRSKQRPRKLRIYGEDGQQFIFLLKGHEDLRQDERAMQLFGLVNALLSHNSKTVAANQEDYSIQRYAVMPLSPTAGLISWVPNCDTLHDLIRSYRESRKIMLDVENKLILQVAPNKMYDSLPVMHKLEVFEYALTYTAGEDLSKILWLKSENSESWLQRRATYTRSLAVMSMVGYVLGLGDRHPSNLMLDRKTGKVLHIDFGDCFEVAMQREKFPEKVPFRLTRMLVNAMEVAGIEGNYRSTCEKVMEVLRENRDSLVATLEAFVHDPLISWRLLNTKKDKIKPVPADPPTPTTATAPSFHPTDSVSSSSNASNASSSNQPNSISSTDAIVSGGRDQRSSTGAGSIVPNTTTPPAVGASSDISPHARSPRNGRPRAHSSALEPIQERRRGSATNMAADIAAAALSHLATVPSTNSNGGDAEDSEYEEDDDSLEQVTKGPFGSGVPQPAPATFSSISSSANADIAVAVVATTISVSPVPREGTSAPSNLTAGLMQQATSDSLSAPFPAEGAGVVSEMQSSFSGLKLSVNIAAANALPPPPATVTTPGGNTTSAVPTSNKHQAGSFKSVSFSTTNQTLQSDNTIRNTSTRVEIVAAAGTSVSSALPNVSTNAADFASGRTSAAGATLLAGGSEIDVVDQYDAAARNINARATAAGADSAGGASSGIAVGSLPGGAGSAFGAPTASFRANLHLEMSNLANSVTMVPASPSAMMGGAMGAEGNNTFAHSLSQSRMSVRSSVAHESKVQAMVSSAVDNEGGDHNDLQQELIEKAVVVIRRVMDKLTGLDFADTAHMGDNMLAHPQHALEVHDQVDRLIKEATSNENLSQSFFGWCPFW